MTLEQQVCSLELAKKLKELGVPQNSLFYWIKGTMVWGYEGEWHIEEAEDWFLLDLVGHKLEDWNFRPDTGDMGESEADYLKWERKQKKAVRAMRMNVFSAFTVAELGEMLPLSIHTVKDKHDFYCWGSIEDATFDEDDLPLWASIGEDIQPIHAETEADARAKMLIWLIENKYISFKEQQ